MFRARSFLLGFSAALLAVFALTAASQLSVAQETLQLASGQDASQKDPPKTETKTADTEKTQKAAAQDQQVPPPREQTAQAGEGETSDNIFVRLSRNDDGDPSSLDTAITKYEGTNSKGEKVTVALIGAIHIADKAYYQKLNKEFTTYEVLLYELVAPKNARPAEGDESMYGVIAQALGLDDQLANIDYGPDNFVHADMSGDEFLKSMEERGESFVKMFFKAMGQAMAQQARMQQQGKSMPSDFQILAALISGDKTALKRAIAPTFEDMEMTMSWMDGPEGSTILTERNKVAMAVMKEQIDAGKTNIGIFYGAGHFRDMERRLINEFKMKPVGQDWLKAWNMER